MDVSLVGSYAKLQNTEIPLEERIEISRKICDSHYFMPNKEQVILDWSCQELSNIRSGKKRDKGGLKVAENEIKLWKMFSEILHDPEGKIVLRHKSFTLLFRELDEIKCFLGKFCSDNGHLSEITQDRVLSIFSCFQAISKNSNISLTFFNKLENLEQYLKGILTCFLGVLSQSHLHSADFVPRLCDLVVLVLQQYNTALHQQVASHKNFINLCEKLLPLLLFGRTLTKNECGNCGVRDSSKKEISYAIDAVIISGLFHKDLVLNYDPTVNTPQKIAPRPKKQKLGNPYKQLFDTLESLEKDDGEGASIEGVNISTDMVYQTISTSLPFLLENFLKVIQADGKAGNTKKFGFFVQLYNVTAPSGSAGNIPEVIKIEVLNKMLKIIVDYNVYEIAEDEANDKSVFKWFLDFLENVLFSKSYHNTGMFYCLDIILKLNHKIIEHFLEIVLAICFKKSEVSSSEDVDKAKVVLLRNIVETYTKLQQLENLIKCMLKVFNELGNELGTISVDVLIKVSKSFEQCPLNQSLSILQYFLSEMKEKVQSVEHKDEYTEVSLEGISTLFVTFAQNSSFNAADPHGLDRTKATSLEQLVRELKITIIMPLINAFPAHRKTSQKQLGFSVLFLIHGLNSLIMFLHQHNVIPASDDHFVEMHWDSKLESFIPEEMCKGLSILKKDRRLRFCMELLVVNKMRRLSLKPNFDQNEYDLMVKILFNFQNSPTKSEISVTWNSDPQCVDSINYPIAHWSLVTQYAPLFIPYCSENQLQAFSEFMIGTLVHKAEQSTQDDLMTLHQISESILKNGELLFLPSLQAAVVKRIWILLGERVRQMVSDKLSDVFSWEAFEDEIDEMEDGQDGNRKRNLQPGKIDMNRALSLAQMITSVMNRELLKEERKEQNRKSDEDLSTIAQLLKVLQRLPCHHFTPSNKVRCILGSLACDVLLESCRDCHHSPAQLSCREIVTTLLQGLLQHREFSVWRVVDMAALLRWIYQTIPEDNEGILAETSPSSVERKFLDVSKELLRFAVVPSLKLSSHGSQSTIDFSKELVASLAGSVDAGNPEMLRCVEVLLIIIYAYTEFLEEKGNNLRSKTVACVISETAFGLTSVIKSILGDENTSQKKKSYVELVVMKLIGILTRAMKSINETKLSENEEFTNASDEWGGIVAMVVVKVLAKMEDVGNSFCGLLHVSDEMTAFITVFADVFKGGQEHCKHIPVESRTQILKKCLEILRDIGRPSGEGECAKSMSNKLEEAVHGLIASLVEEDAGRNFISVLERVIEWSIEENEVSTLLTGFTVFRDLLTTKVAKQNKKELRSVAANIVITLLSKAVTNNGISIVVLETVAALVVLGAGVFYPHEVSLVFQALSLKPEVPSLESFSRIFTAKFNILSWTLFYYSDYVYGAVHVFLPFVRELLNLLLTQGAKMPNGKMESEEEVLLLSCVEKMSRLYQEMASHKGVLSKYSIYFLADCVHVICTHSVPEMMREVLVQGVCFLFDICSDDGLQKLHIYLPNNERELFRSLKNDYMKHHKFKGNA